MVGPVDGNRSGDVDGTGLIGVAALRATIKIVTGGVKRRPVTVTEATAQRFQAGRVLAVITVGQRIRAKQVTFTDVQLIGIVAHHRPGGNGISQRHIGGVGNGADCNARTVIDRPVQRGGDVTMRDGDRYTGPDSRLLSLNLTMGAGEGIARAGGGDGEGPQLIQIGAGANGGIHGFVDDGHGNRGIQ